MIDQPACVASTGVNSLSRSALKCQPELSDLIVTHFITKAFKILKLLPLAIIIDTYWIGSGFLNFTHSTFYRWWVKGKEGEIEKEQIKSVCVCTCLCARVHVRAHACTCVCVPCKHLFPVAVIGP